MAGFCGQRSNVRKLGEHRAFPVDVDEDRRRAENLRIADARTMVFLRLAQKFSSSGLRNLRKSIYRLCWICRLREIRSIEKTGW